MRALVFASAAVLLACLPAHADTVTDLVTFQTPTEFELETGSGKIINMIGPPITGSYTITFDPTQDTPNPPVPITDGLVVNSFSYQFSQPVISGYGYSAENGELYITGSNAPNGVQTVGYELDLYNINSDSPDFSVAKPLYEYLEIGDGSVERTYYEDYGGEGVVTVTRLSSATPEPSTFALFGTGLISVAILARRRFAKRASK